MRCAGELTLVEVVIVILIIGIAAVVAVPMLHTALTSMRLSAAAHELAAALEYAQMTALGSGQPCRVTIDAATDSVLVEQKQYHPDVLGGAQTSLPETTVEAGTFAAMDHPLEKGSRYAVAFSQEPRLAGVDILSVAFGTGGVVEYDAHGVPSVYGSVTMRLGTRLCNVGLEFPSGKAVISH